MAARQARPGAHRSDLVGWRRPVVAAVVPLVLVGGGWSALAWGTREAPTTAGGRGAGTGGTAASDPATLLPPLPTAPYSVPAAPAASQGAVAPGVAGQPEAVVVSSLAANGIPESALRAYRRAETLLGRAAPSCRLSWQLLAAIGRVESNHGRFGGNVLTTSGVAVPGVFGPRLDGSGGFAVVRDTDAGRLDRDPVFDRAVGPMQFLPGTWRVAGVDADGDGRRDPQNIFDAAAAAGRYLCAGGADLSSLAGQRAAVFRYNHSWRYVDLVLAVARAYGAGRWASVPDGQPAPGRGDSAAPAPGPRGATRPVPGTTSSQPTTTAAPPPRRSSSPPTTSATTSSPAPGTVTPLPTGAGGVPTLPLPPIPLPGLPSLPLPTTGLPLPGLPPPPLG